jgi:hypothetical protein
LEKTLPPDAGATSWAPWQFVQMGASPVFSLFSSVAWKAFALKFSAGWHFRQMAEERIRYWDLLWYFPDGWVPEEKSE